MKSLATSSRFLDSRKSVAWIMRELRRPTMTPIFAWFLLATLAGGKFTALADNVTIVVKNSAGKMIFPRMVYGGSDTGSKDHPAVPPNRSINIPVEHNKTFSLFFATGCRGNSGHLRNCSSGDCPNGSCSVEDRPIATLIDYVNGTVMLSMRNGFNFGILGAFQCDACDCPSISCIIPALSQCAEELRIYEASGLLVACRAGDWLPSGQDAALPSSYFPPSSGTTCNFKNVILKITVTSSE